MAESGEQVNSLLLPMRGFNLVLPHANVAEVLQGVEPEPYGDRVPWLSGTIEWRGVVIPLVSYETLCGREGKGAGETSAAVVVYGLEGFGDLKFYALELQGIPRPVVLDAGRIESVEDESAEGNEFIARNVLVAGQPGVIPELASMEHRIEAGLGSA